MEPTESDEDLAFVGLLTEHQIALRSYINSLLPGDSAAADVSQLANTTIWKKRDTFEMGTNFKAWIFSIARYEVLNYRKKQARDSRLVFSDELEEIFAEELPEIDDQTQQRQKALRECLDCLKSSEQELISIRYFESVSLGEYAQKVGRSEGGLKVSLHRIRNKLQSCIEGRMSVEGGQA